MVQLFNVVLYQPILNFLVLIYNFIPGHDIGVAIILMTIIIKLILYPFSLKSIKSQKALQEIQPKIEALKVKYKNQKEKLAQEMMVLYKNEKVSPFSSCLPLLIQLPFLIAVYQVFNRGLSNGSLDSLYSFISNPGVLNPITLGFLDLSKPQIFLALLAGLAQFWQVKMLNTKKPEVKTAGSKDESMMVIMNKQMTFLMPIMTVFIGASLPGGLVLYWFMTTLLTALMQLVAFKKKKQLNMEVIDNHSKETIN
ncbi:MAG: YidC/Oxa1 family membrane protein insertase [Candidatus Buchananbacteria bacterium]|nr:YidC/Oxa1 family membrane protein insertase [Candidatus Buchananbacteria bacterium]